MNELLQNNISWEAETTRIEKDSRIAWKSIDGDLKTSRLISK